PRPRLHQASSQAAAGTWPAMTWRNSCTTMITLPAPRAGRADRGCVPRPVSPRPAPCWSAAPPPPPPRLAAPPSTAAPTPGPTPHLGYPPAVKLVVTNPRPGDISGTGGDFIVNVVSTAQNATGNQQLSAANGYRPGLNLPPARTFGPAMPDPDAPGLVVTLS